MIRTWGGSDQSGGGGSSGGGFSVGNFTDIIGGIAGLAQVGAGIADIATRTKLEKLALAAEAERTKQAQALALAEQHRAAGAASSASALAKSAPQEEKASGTSPLLIIGGMGLLGALAFVLLQPKKPGTSAPVYT